MNDMLTGFLIRPDGTAERVTLDQVDGSTLADMRLLLEARSVDVVEIGPVGGQPCDAWIDDEGLGVSPTNLLAAVVFTVLSGKPQTQALAGNVLLLSHRDEFSTSLSDDTLERIGYIADLAQGNGYLQQAIAMEVAEVNLANGN